MCNYDITHHNQNKDPPSTITTTTDNNVIRDDEISRYNNVQQTKMILLITVYEDEFSWVSFTKSNLTYDCIRLNAS